MSKNKTVFVCQECGHESSGWLGKCPACSQWNTFVEEMQMKNTGNSGYKQKSTSKPVSIRDIHIENETRFLTGMAEMDRVLGGGMVKGSLILVGGDPGIGKSTLILQICDTIRNDGAVLYISGEESVKQIKLRADRLSVVRKDLLMVSETDFSHIEKMIDEQKPALVVIDSIQTVCSDTVTSAAGSVSQVREATAGFVRLAKTLNIPIIIVGHVTKEGAIAGPRVLEHMVDTVLYFEGERHSTFRILRAVKNRFGSTNEIGIFEMKEKGLSEVENPSSLLLSGRPEEESGSVVVAGMEGTRPLLIEIQALVSPTNFGMPRRMATGVDYNRVVLLMAVLEKRIGMMMGNHDAYVNIIGGIRVDEPACDLGIIIALASSFRDSVVDAGTIVIGEVGLTGEIRGVSHIEKRIMEASRIGYKKCIIPKDNKKLIDHMKLEGISVKNVENVRQALDLIL